MIPLSVLIQSGRTVPLKIMVEIYLPVLFYGNEWTSEFEVGVLGGVPHEVLVYVPHCLFHVSTTIWTNKNSLVLPLVKGTVSRDFLILVYWWISLPPAPEYSIRNFFENLRRYLQVKVHHRYQRHRGANLPPVSTTPAAKLPLVSTAPAANFPPISTTMAANFSTSFASHQYQRQNCHWYQQHRRQISYRYQRHWRQIFPPVSLALLIPVANLPLVSTILATATSINDTCGKQLKQYQAAGILMWIKKFICSLYYP